MTTWTITIVVGPAESDDGFIDYLLGEIEFAVNSTDVEGLPVATTVVVSDAR